MTDKMIPVPRELLTELRDAAEDAWNLQEIMKFTKSDVTWQDYKPLVQSVDALLREAALPECCGNPAQCWEPCGELGKSAEYARPADEELRRDANRVKELEQFIELAFEAHPNLDLDVAAIAAEKREGS